MQRTCPNSFNLINLLQSLFLHLRPTWYVLQHYIQFFHAKYYHSSSSIILLQNYLHIQHCINTLLPIQPNPSSKEKGREKDAQREEVQTL